MTYKIPVQNLGLLEHRLAKLNKRADKLGVPHITTTEVASYCAYGRDDWGQPIKTRPIYEIDIAGAAIGLTGWRFVGTIEHTPAGNIMRAAPECAIPASYRDATPHCDHCGTDRRRKNTYVVQHWGSGETKQIGRQCTRDFLGHIDPDRLATYMQWVADLGADASDEERARHIEAAWQPTDIVASALAAIRATGGFRPASFDDSTANIVRDAIGYQTKFTKKHLDRIGYEPATADDYTEAAQLVEWVTANTDTGDYIHNLRVAATLDWANSKHIGLLASLPKAVQTAAERQLETERRAAAKAEREVNSSPAPEGKVEVTGQVVKLTAVETDFGTTDKMIVASDDGYSVYVTVPISIDPKVGDRVSFTATLTRGRDADFAFGKRPSKATVCAA